MVLASDQRSVEYPIRVARDIGRRGREFLRANRDRPFFLWLHFFDAHDPYGPPPAFAAKFRGEPYLAEIASVDSEVGDILQASVASRSLRDMAFGNSMIAMAALLRRHKIVAAPAWASLVLMLITIEGLARHVDPDLNIGETIKPHLRGFLRKLYLMNPALQERRARRARSANGAGV